MLWGGRTNLLKAKAFTLTKLKLNEVGFQAYVANVYLNILVEQRLIITEYFGVGTTYKNRNYRDFYT